MLFENFWGMIAEALDQCIEFAEERHNRSEVRSNFRSPDWAMAQQLRTQGKV